MASETTENTSETTRQIVAVPAPIAGEAVAVRSASGAELDFGFNPSAAVVSRDGNSLVFELDNGGTVTLVGFFAVGDQPLPDFRTPDGVLVASLDFFAGSDIDVRTAAPGGTAPGSGGISSYDDNAGAMLGGVDRLGTSSNRWQWSSDQEEFTRFQQLSELPSPPPVIDISLDANGNAAVAMEGSDLVFAIGQSAASLYSTSVDWSITVPATAPAGSHTASFADFDAAQFSARGISAVDNGDGTWTLSGTATIAAGQTSAEIRIPTYDDVIVEGNESLSLMLFNVTGGAQLPGGVTEFSYTGTIIDNDLRIGPVDPGKPVDPTDPDSYVTDGNAAVAVEGNNLVFT
ncbi:MAG: hypothetical protein LBM64_00305, partial [Deltaproteobacteria bacterium]|nr:hypothetical protein [Deltaproteobacteria bacterium]